jgi:hypothetical protein
MCDWDLLAQKLMDTSVSTTFDYTVDWASRNGFVHKEPNFSSLREALRSAMSEYHQNINTESGFDAERKKNALMVELNRCLDCHHLPKI